LVESIRKEKSVSCCVIFQTLSKTSIFNFTFETFNTGTCQLYSQEFAIFETIGSQSCQSFVE